MRFGRGSFTPLVLFPLFGLLPLLGCAQSIARADLLERITAGTAPVIVDVRSQAEYEEGHVPGAVHVPFYALLSRADELPRSSDPEEPLVLYCEHGPRAGLARAQLWLTDGRPVRFLEGHMIAWKRDGLPMESGEPAGPAHGVARPGADGG